MNNTIIFNEEVVDINTLKMHKIHLTLNGNNNEIKLNEFKGNGQIFIELNCNNSKVSVGTNTIINNSVYILCPLSDSRTIENITVEIGNDNFFNGNVCFLASIESGNIVKMGSKNLLAGNITIRGRNDHLIYDKTTHEILNKEKSIIIGNENWICENVNFLPGAQIRDNSVVALGSLVNKNITDSNLLIAGIPAKVKKENICWSRASKEDNIDYDNPLNIKL